MKKIHNIIYATIITVFWLSSASWSDALCQNLAAGDACGSVDLELCFGFRCVPIQSTLECVFVPLSSSTVCRNTQSVCGVDQFCPGPRIVSQEGPGNCPNPTGDSDNDGIIDCNDLCPFDPNKQAPGVCGCGTPDIDTDGDGTFDCKDNCPTDPQKIRPGKCGCGQNEEECSRRRDEEEGGKVPGFYPVYPISPIGPTPLPVEITPNPVETTPIDADLTVVISNEDEPEPVKKKSGCSATGSLNSWFLIILPLLWQVRIRSRKRNY